MDAAPVFTPPRYLLVMTATIAPAPGTVKRSSPQLRLEDYKRALRFWLRQTHASTQRILFLENSGADLTELRDLAASENTFRKEIEILSLPPQQIPDGLTYGYAELQMLDDGLAQSRLRPATTHMIKVTGRLTFPALGKALDQVATDLRQHPASFELMIDCRKLGFPRRGFDASVQLFVCSHAFYDRLLRGIHREMNSTDLRILEHLILRKVIPFKGEPGYYLRFPCNIDPIGYFGFKNRRYDSPRTALTRNLRSLLRRIAPDYWF
jgi:hypothetical protein